MRFCRLRTYPPPLQWFLMDVLNLYTNLRRENSSLLFVFLSFLLFYFIQPYSILEPIYSVQDFIEYRYTLPISKIKQHLFVSQCHRMHVFCCGNLVDNTWLVASECYVRYYKLLLLVVVYFKPDVI
jgi:hypothetical protein